MKDFIVGVVSHRGIHPLTATSIEFAHQELGNRFLVKYDSGDAWLDRLRSVAITQFYTHKWADYFIFLDDDIIFSPNHLLKIYEDLKAGYRLVGGLYPTRNGSQLSSYGGGEEGGILLDGGIKEIKWLATGFMGIARSLLKDMIEKLNLPLLHKGMWCECYPFFIFKNDMTMLFSEDWEFCEKAKLVGDKVYADTSVLVGHVGEKIVSVQDAVKHSERLAEKKIVRNQLVQDASEFLGKPIEDINKFVDSNPGPEMWREFTDSGLSLGEFYKQDRDSLIYDLIEFNSALSYLESRSTELLPIKDKHILDFGCGIGTIAAFLSENNHVYGYDINPKVIDFCNFQKQKHGIKATFSTDFPDSKFDFVIAIDVFEHIPELKETLRRIYEVLEVGGKLYHYDSFTQGIPVHLNHTKDFDNWLEEVGFTKINNRWAEKAANSAAVKTKNKQGEKKQNESKRKRL